MPVANNQMEEVYNILRKYLTQTQLRDMVLELRDTEAYKRNNSFAETINRLRRIMYPMER